MKKLLALFLCSAALLVAQVAIPAGNAVTITNSGNNIPGSGPYSPTSFPTGQVLYGNGSGPIASSAGFTTNGTSVNASSYGMLDQFALTNYGYINYSDASLTADRVLTLSLANASRTLTISGNSTINQDTSTAGTPSFAGLTSTSTAILTSAATSGLQIYNTADQTTTVQRLEALYSSSIATIGTRTIGTIASTPLHIFSQTANAGAFYTKAIVGSASGSFPGILFGLYTSQTGTTLASVNNTGTFISLGNYTNTATSGTVVNTAITPTYNQASGNAANTDLKIARTETTLGSGAQRFVEFFAGASGTTSLFSVVNNGHVLLGGLTTDGTGVLQFPAATTSAGGITMGTDINLFRSAASRLDLSAPSSVLFRFLPDGNVRGYWQQNGSTATLSSSAGSMILASNDTTALTLDSSQNAQFVGKATTYNSLTTAGNGLVSIQGAGRATAQTSANASVATYTVGASDASFVVSSNVLVTTSTTYAFTVTCAYTDEGNTSRTITFTFSNVGGTLLTSIANTGGAVPYEGIPLHIRAKAATAITIATTGTFTSVTYNVEGVITKLQ